jgi:hypothetical protein
MENDLSVKILSDIIVYMKYAKYIENEKRRETWEEIVTRNKTMHIKKYPDLKEEIEEAYKMVYDKKIVPSMRSLQFAGKPIDINPSRIYNCTAVAIDHPDSFSEIMFLLLSGAGVGYSVQRHHIKKLPSIRKPIPPKDGRHKKKRYLIGDSIEGWSDAIKVLMKSYFKGDKEIEFDYRDIRAKGERLITSGGKAPGPQPLKDCIHNIRKILDTALEERGDNSYIKPIEAHDIICYISDAVLSGGIRRSACISLFSFNDTEMLESKFGSWWELNPQRARANNSVVLVRHKINKESFFKLWEKIKESGCGEPGFFLTNDKNYLTNPCLTGDTLVPLADGSGKLITLKEISDQDLDVPIYSLDNDGKIIIEKLRGTQLTRKNALVYELKLDNGEIIKATGDHKIRLNSGIWKEICELKSGDSLWPMVQYESPLFSKRKSQNYRWINTKGINISEHRLITKQILNENIPLEKNTVIHHIDYNGLNNNSNNLKIMSKKEHDEFHKKDMYGKNNPKKRKKYIEKLCKATKGLKNANSKNITNKEIREEAKNFVKNLGYLPTTKEWEIYSKKNNIPLLTSDYRIKDLGTPYTLLKWSAIKVGILPEEAKNLSQNLLHHYFKYLEKGYNCKIKNGEIVFKNICELTKKEFETLNPYQVYCDEVSLSDRIKYSYDYQASCIARKESYNKKNNERKYKQAELYNELKYNLGREPLKKEWEKFCKENNTSSEISRNHSPFRSWKLLKEFSESLNHKVISVRKHGVEDVYDGIVDNYHNFFIGGRVEENTKDGRYKRSFINVANCAEISLKSMGTCNLTSINVSNINDQNDFNERCKSASLIGTLQAGYTDFHYLREGWKDQVEKESLIGVSMTGIANKWFLENIDLKEGANIVKKENSRVAKLIGINKAYRCNTTKPEGSSSLVMGTSSGIHAWHSKYYIRRIRVGKDEAIYNYLATLHPEIIEDEFFKPEKQAVISVPVKAPENSIYRTESALDTLERVKKVNIEWIREGHRKGSNYHNVSCTISIKDDEWDIVGNWMWENKEYYNGISVLPYDGGTYKQAPFEEISKEEYEQRYKKLKNVDIRFIQEDEDNVDHKSIVACGGGQCIIT